jgi:hypothetical protein
MEFIRYLPNDIPDEVLEYFSYPHPKEKYPRGKELLRHLLLYKQAVENREDEIIVVENFMHPSEYLDFFYDKVYEDLSTDTVLLSHYVEDWSLLKVDEDSESGEILESKIPYSQLHPWAYLINYDQMERALDKYFKPFRLWEEVSLDALFPPERTRMYQRALFFREGEEYKSYYDYYR